MKNRGCLLMTGFAILAFTLAGCENALTGGEDHGGLKTSIASVRSVTADPVQDCVIETAHTHNGGYYSGHYNNDGHGHHGLPANEPCAQPICQETGLHQHNGTHYAGHSGDDGCGHGRQHGNGHE